MMSQKPPEMTAALTPAADASVLGHGLNGLVQAEPPYMVELENYQYTPYSDEDADEMAHAALVGREQLLDSFVQRLTKANGGGSFLVNGYRGVGKTSFVNAAVRRLRDFYRAGSAPAHLVTHYEPVIVRINLARTLSPDVLMARIVRQIYSELSTPNRRLFGRKWRMNWPPATSRSLLDILDTDTRTFLELAVLRTGAQVSDTESTATERKNTGKAPEVRLPVVGISVPLGLPGERSTTRSTSRSRSIQFQSYNTDAAEDDLLELLARLGHFGDLRTRAARSLGIMGLRLIFIFDEIDKLEATAKSAQGDTKELMSSFTQIVGLLKNVFTSSRAIFIFIAGRETHRQWQRDSAGGEGILESVFGQEFYLPCLWEDLAARFIASIRNGSPTLSAADEQRLVQLKKYLKFKGRGIARKLNREFYDLLVFRDRTVELPSPDSPEDADRAFWQRIEGYADLYDRLNDVIYRRIYTPDFGEDAGFSGLHIEALLDRQVRDTFEEQRLGVYYLADRLIDLEVFRRDEMTALLAEFTENIRPPREEVLQGMLDSLVKGQFFKERTFLIDNEPILTYAPGAALDHLKGRRLSQNMRYRTQPMRAIVMSDLAPPGAPSLPAPAEGYTFADLAVEAAAALNVWLDDKEANPTDDRVFSINGWAALVPIGVVERLRQNPRMVSRLADLDLLSQADNRLFAVPLDPGAGLADTVDPTAGPPSGDSVPRIATILTICATIAGQLGEGYFDPLLQTIEAARAELAHMQPGAEGEALMLLRIRRSVTQRLLSSLTRYADMLIEPGKRPEPPVLLVNVDGPRELRVHVPYFARWLAQIAANPRGLETKPIVILLNPAQLSPGSLGQFGRLEYFPTVPADAPRMQDENGDERNALMALNLPPDTSLPAWLVTVALRAQVGNDRARLARLHAMLTLDDLAPNEYSRFAAALTTSTRLRRWFTELAIYRHFDLQTLAAVADHTPAWQAAKETPDIILTTLLRYPQLLQPVEPSGYQILPPLRRALLARPDDRDPLERQARHLRAKEYYATRMGLPPDAGAHDLRSTYSVGETDLDNYWRVEWAYHLLQSELTGDFKGGALALLDLVDYLTDFALVSTATRAEVDALLHILEESAEGRLDGDEELSFEIRTRRAEWYLLCYEAIGEDESAAARTQARKLLAGARTLLQDLLDDTPARRDTWPRFRRYIEAQIKLARVLAAEGDPLPARDSLLAALDQAELWDATSAIENILLRLAQIASDLGDWQTVILHTTRYQTIAAPEENGSSDAAEIDYLQGNAHFFLADVLAHAPSPDLTMITEHANAAENAFLSSVARLDALPPAEDTANDGHAAANLRQKRNAAALLLRYLALARLNMLRAWLVLPHADAPHDAEAGIDLWLDDARLRYALAVPLAETIEDAIYTARLFTEQTRLEYTVLKQTTRRGKDLAPGALRRLLALAEETRRLLEMHKDLQSELHWPHLYTDVRELGITPLG